MSNFKSFITPEEARQLGDTRSLEKLRMLASAPARKCMVCDELVWRYGGIGMCFSCNTGEADASEDYELQHTPKSDDDYLI